MAHLSAVPDLPSDGSEPAWSSRVDTILEAAARTYWHTTASAKAPRWDDLPSDNQHEVRAFVEQIVLTTLDTAIRTGYHHRGDR